jgi:hypothetical protein
MSVDRLLETDAEIDPAPDFIALQQTTFWLAVAARNGTGIESRSDVM